MKISVCLSTSPAKFDAVPFKGDFVENITAISSMGFDGVELAIRDPKLIDQESVLQTIKAANLEIPAIGTGQAWGEEGLSFTDPDPSVRRQAVERVIAHFEFAKKAKAVVIIGLLRGIVQPNVSTDKAQEWMYSNFSRCCDAAEKEGVQIAFEPINRYETSLLNSVAEGLGFIDKVGSPSLGMLLDTFHMNIEEPSIEASIHAAKGRIFHFHYADSNRLYPGAGHLDFESILRALYATGYERYVSAEHMSGVNAKESTRLGLEHMKRMYNEISFQE